MDNDMLRAQLARALDGVDARMTLADAVAAFPDDAMNVRPPNVEYTPWQLLEHVRLTQVDILEYVLVDDYVEHRWPDDFWPDRAATATREQWDDTIRRFHADLDALKALVLDPARDLFAAIPGTPGHTLLREVRIVADHNAYHVGEFAVLRQVMGTWPEGHE